MNSLKHIFLATLYILISGMTVFAQADQLVTGLVTEKNGDPIPGVTVVVVGTTIGGYTNIDGEFSVQTEQSKGEAVELNISFIGYISQTIKTTVGSNLKIELIEDVQMLDELVVVGYDTQKKSHLTGSISKMETQGLENVPTSRADQLLQGRVAGVQIQNTTSEVGVEAEINIRGVGSISASSQPLIIVDGFPIEDGLGVVDAADISSIEVLKDAASAAIYGSRAANGVILVTTKSGSLSKPKYSFKTSFGVKTYHDLHPIMTTTEYVDMVLAEDLLQGDTQLSAQAFAMSTIDNSTNWQEEALRQATISNSNLSISGGKEEVKYYISSSFLTDEGIMVGNRYDKFSLRSKLDVKLSPKARVGTNMNATYSYRMRPTVNFTDFYRTPSFMPVRHTEQTAELTGYEVGEYAHGAHFNDVAYTGIDPISGVERSVYNRPFNTTNTNPASRIENETRERDEYRLQSSLYIEYEFLKNLKFKTSNGFNIRYREEIEYANEGSSKAGSTNSGYYTTSLYTDLLTENTLSYAERIRRHDINVLLGASAQATNLGSAGIYGIDFPTDYIHKLNAAGVILQYDGDDHVTGTWEEAASMASFFSRFMYAFDDKYLMSASIRTDGSSKFGEESRWGWFPSVSLGWRLAQEEWFKTTFRFIDALKFRVSYGVTGTDDIESYANMDLLTAANYSFNGNDPTPGMANNSTTLGNSSLQWEQTNEYNAGFDFYVLDSRLGLVLDAYYSITKSLLYQRSINSISGYTEAWSNEGKVRNKGLELTINSHNIKTKDFSWNTTLNVAHNSNRLLDLGGPQQIISQGERSERYLARVGDPLVQFYGYESYGVWNTQDEIANNPSHISDSPGGLRLVDQNNDGTVNDQDLVAMGDPFPDFTWGISNQLNYKNWDMSFLFQGSQGGEIWVGDGYYKESSKYNKAYTENRWIDADNPGDGVTPFEANGIAHMETDRYVQDASYVAFKDLSLGYKFDKDQLKKANIRSLRFYGSAQNLFIWTTNDYKGINVEARSTSSYYASPLIQGYQRGAFPTQRTFNFGLEIVF